MHRGQAHDGDHGQIARKQFRSHHARVDGPAQHGFDGLREELRALVRERHELVGFARAAISSSVACGPISSNARTAASIRALVLVRFNCRELAATLPATTHGHRQPADRPN
ncbi:hypothetical protein ACIHFD_63030 [Nonomuraea sp. NPDC051941]|uniref:hypothetical protein n=1 Tax=Nonomuraea sp. NPDC051941 TaxID=3364373 RepID=UPI0037CB3301